MNSLHAVPDLDLDDDRALAEVHQMRAGLATVLRAPRRWTGGLRRSARAQAIRGSNSIEGYVVSEQDALAAVDDDEPLTADERTWAEIVGYRRVLTYALRLASTPGFRVDAMTLRSMHFMLLEHAAAMSVKAPTVHGTITTGVDPATEPARTGLAVVNGHDARDPPTPRQGLLPGVHGAVLKGQRCSSPIASSMP